MKRLKNPIFYSLWNIKNMVKPTFFNFLENSSSWLWGQQQISRNLGKRQCLPLLSIPSTRLPHFIESSERYYGSWWKVHAELFLEKDKKKRRFHSKALWLKAYCHTDYHHWRLGSTSCKAVVCFCLSTIHHVLSNLWILRNLWFTVLHLYLKVQLTHKRIY